MINTNLETILQNIIKNPLERKDNFYKIGQNYLKSIEGKELIDLVDAILNYFCQNANQWKGDLMIPPFYRYYHNNNHPKDIWYTLKEYFMWSIFYPNEINEHLVMDEEGFIKNIGDSSVRIISRENKTEQIIDSSGKKITREIKPNIDYILPSGFSMAQKHDITSTCLAGILPHSPRYSSKIVEKKSTKRTKKSPILVSENINNVVESDSKPKKRITKKKTTEVVQENKE